VVTGLLTLGSLRIDGVSFDRHVADEQRRDRGISGGPNGQPQPNQQAR
jgi:hypothetical protein